MYSDQTLCYYKFIKKIFLLRETIGRTRARYTEHQHGCPSAVGTSVAGNHSHDDIQYSSVTLNVMLLLYVSINNKLISSNWHFRHSMGKYVARYCFVDEKYLPKKLQLNRVLCVAMVMHSKCSTSFSFISSAVILNINTLGMALVWSD